MVGKGKSTVRTRSQRQGRFSQPKKVSASSSDEEDRGVTPTPPPAANTGGTMRRRALRKRLQVLASSDDDTGSEDGKTTTNGAGSVESVDNSDPTTDDEDPVERMKEIDRLPAMIMQVRKLNEQIATVCDAMERTLTSDGPNQDVELESCKKKLANLTERCYHIVVPAAARASGTAKLKTKQGKQAGRASRISEETVPHDDAQSTSKKRVDRSSSEDYTEYAPPEDKETESLPADESAKDSGNPSSGHDESGTMMKTTEDLPSYVELDRFSPTPVFNEYETEPIREVQDDVTEERVTDLNPDSVEIPVTTNDDSENFYDPSQIKESDVEKGVLNMQESSGSSKAEDSVINDDIFNIHNYANNPVSVPTVASRLSPQDASVTTAKLQKQHSHDTPVGIGIHETGRRRLITDAAPNFSTPSSVIAENSVKPNPKPESPALYQPTEPISNEIKPKIELDVLYQAEPSTSKDSYVPLVSLKDGSSKSKFVTNADPNPNREPTNEEIPYVVPHLPKFSVTQTPQGENYELSLMKREIEMRLRVNDLSWVTQRAIRDESARVKKVARNNERLDLELKRFGDVLLSANQLILDYDPEKKTFIRVHPELVAKMKPHQKEGIKFMYDCCYGGALGSRSTAGSGCILAHCMGLGKTMQVIALMNTVICYPQLNTKRVIVVCPKSTVMNWVQEIRHWLGDIQSGVSVQVFHLPDSSNIYKKMEVLRGFHNVTGKNAHCLLIGYEAFRALVFYDARNKNGEQHSERVRTEVRRILINPGPDLMVLDEGHIIKNRKSQTNLSVSEVATKRRIILTGTPIQNNLNEYFCMVSFVKPAYLGNEREFNENYAKPIKDGQHKDSDKVDIRIMKMKSFILHKHLAAFVQRKEFSVLQGFLPEKYEYVLYVPLTPVQEDLYEQYLKRNPFRRDVGGTNLLEDYTFMRKIWTHPIVLERAWENAMKKKYGVKEKRRVARRVRGFDSSSEDDDDNDADNMRSITNVWWKQLISKDDLESLFPSNKMLLLFEILRMCQERGEKCLIFSGFVMVLNMVEHFMKMIDEQSKNPKAQLYGFSRFRGPWRPGMDYYRLDGGTSKSVRHEMITKFNDPKNRVTRVFLISTKAGGQGINLVGANRVVILDTSWNPAVDQQGIFRIYRLGQQKSCYIYRLLAIHTMEEKVYSRAVTKQAMSHRVADKKQVDRNYNMAELEELYHFERVNMSARPISAPAVDDVLSNLLLKFPKLIFRYHTHETMLDNKTEQDLTDFEKQLAWTEFKKKGLTMNLHFGIGDEHGGELGKTDSQLSEMDVDPELQDMFEKKCIPKYEVPEPDPVDTPSTPLAIPVRQSFGKKFDEKLLDVDPEPVEDESAIFGEDPYNELSLGGSIIEQQRKRLAIKQEPDTPTPSQVTVSEDEIGLLRALEEESGSAVGSVQIKQEDPLGHSAEEVVRDAPVVDTIDMLDLSYEGADGGLEPTEPVSSVPEPELTDPSTSVEVSTDMLSSMIEYDPITSSQDNVTCTNPTYLSDLSSTAPVDGSVTEPSTYEKFEASLNTDPNAATSTTAAPSVVLVVSSMGSPAMLTVEPPMTRSMKRKMMAVSSSAVKPKKAKMCPGNNCSELLKRSTAHQSNQCRSLVPYIGRQIQRITINVHLKQYLEQTVKIPMSTNSCRTIVPYVKRVSLLEDILHRIGSFLLPDAQVDNDVIDVERSSSQVVCQTTTLSWNGEDVNFADLESCYDESSGMYYTADTDFHAIHDDSDHLTLTQCTLPDSQQVYTQQVIAQKDNEEFMTDLEELRAALSDEIQPDTSKANCSAVVLYNPPVSLWDQQKHEHLLNETAPMAMYRPVRSFWDQREFQMRLYQAERKRQIIRNQRNKCHRFIPYDKDDRKWCKETPPVDKRSSIMQPAKGMPTNRGSMALLPYSGNSILDAIRESKSFFKPKSVVLCSELKEYLTFCRHVTCQSTSQGMASPKAQRGVKRRCENLSHIQVGAKKWKRSESIAAPKTVLGERNQ